MSFLQYPEAMNAPELQVWNNAAFDNEESGGFPMKNSWSSLHPVFENHSESLDSDCSKENLSPAMVNSPVSVKSLIPIKPLHSNGVIGNSQSKNSKVLVKNGGHVESSSTILKKGCDQEDGKTRDEKKIDSEIEEIENEIKRLSSRLEALRLEKAERIAKTIERRGRIVPAKFMETKQSVKKTEEPPLSSSARAKFNRRGVSLGPSEIVAGARFRPPGKLDISITPVQQTQSRRKSCFWKIQEIDEGKARTERRKSLSLSPKSRRTVSKIEAQKQAATTVGSKKCGKKESGVLSLIQPRKLFKDGEKSVPTKKPLKPGRVVASRYNQISGNSSSAMDARKRSLPENDKDDGSKRCDKKRASSVGRMKKRWEIPPDIVVYKSEEEEEKKKPSSSSSSSMADITDLLPKIKTVRCIEDSPRGSGAAKRVAELKGKRSFFYPDENENDDHNDDAEPSACQALSFAEEEEEEDR